MKKAIRTAAGLSALLLFAGASAAAVQVSSAGLKFGLNLTGMSTDESGLDLKSQTGFAGGGFLSFSLGENFAVQPEVYFSQKGAKYDFEEQGVAATYHFNFSYIEIPVLIKAYIPLESDVVRPLFFLGPYVGFKAGAKTKYEISAYGETQTGEEDMVGVKSTDFGGVFGVGAEIRMGTGKICLEARYGLGLVTISTEGDSTKLHAFTFLFGYSFF